MSAILSRAMLLEAVDSMVRDRSMRPARPRAGRHHARAAGSARPGRPLCRGGLGDGGGHQASADRLPVDTIGPLAEALAARLRELPHVADARPWHGWVNIWLDDAALGRLLPRLLANQPWEAPPLAPLHVPLAECSSTIPGSGSGSTHVRCRSVQRAARTSRRSGGRCPAGRRGAADRAVPAGTTTRPAAADRERRAAGGGAGHLRRPDAAPSGTAGGPVRTRVEQLGGSCQGCNRDAPVPGPGPCR